jgi:PIN domain nuclease of toxin-antitoxin system
MRLLLDTHTLIWWTLTPERLSQRVLSLLDDSSNDLIFSVASVWEMQIKIQLGKLKLNMPLASLIDNQQQTNDLQILRIELVQVLALQNLPNHHRDPFDRLLIAQAIVEQVPILSLDTAFDAYPVERWW